MTLVTSQGIQEYRSTCPHTAFTRECLNLPSTDPDHLSIDTFAESSL